MTNREDFEEWYIKTFCIRKINTYGVLKKNQANQYIDWGICKMYLAWQEQQKKIDALEKQINRMIEEAR